MAVLCQAITVISQVSTISEKYPGGLHSYLVRPDGVRFSDSVLTAASFMAPQDVGAHVGELESFGLRFLDESREAVDFVVVDQGIGQTTPCAWLQTDQIDGIRWAWPTGSKQGELVAYESWTPAAYQSMRMTPNEEVKDVEFEPTELPGVRKVIHPDGTIGYHGSPYG